MGFLTQFDQSTKGGDHGAARDLLLDAMRRDPIGLCDELRRNRPILEFVSLHPGNPDVPNLELPDRVYLLTRFDDVQHALEHFSMQSYSRQPNRYFLGIDDREKHEKLRSVFALALERVKRTQIDQWAEHALEEALDLYQKPTGDNTGSLHIDVRGMSREVALRFCGRIYNLPREQVVGGPFRQATAGAFEDFIWKLFARHFKPKDEAYGQHINTLQSTVIDALELAGRELARNNGEPRTFTEHLLLLGRGTDAPPAMRSSELVANLIGAFQGFIDNAVSSTCTALSDLLPVVSGTQADGMDSNQRTERFERLRTAATERRKRLASLTCTTSTDREAINNDAINIAIDTLRAAQRRLPPSPWLPRIGHINELPSIKDHCLRYDFDKPGQQRSEVACILAIGSAMADTTGQRSLELANRQISSDEARYNSPDDLRLGYGFRRCVGRELGDRLVAHILLRLAEFDELRVLHPLARDFGWIVRTFGVTGSVPAGEAAVHWDRLPGTDRVISVRPGNGTAEAAQRTGVAGTPNRLLIDTEATLRSMAPEDLIADPALFAELSTRQLQSLTDRQIMALRAPHIACLGERLGHFTAEQLVMLDREALGALTREQIDVLDSLQIRALEIVAPDNDPLTDTAQKALHKQTSRHAIRSHLLGIRPRPHAYSLWSAVKDPDAVEPYISWPGLTDRSWTARHVRALTTDTEDSARANQPRRPSLGEFKSTANPGPLTELFKRPPDRQVQPGRSSLLFVWFAQWLSDSFLRTDRSDRRRNRSNHDVDLAHLYGPDEHTTCLLRKHKGGKLEFDGESGREFLPKLYDAAGNVRKRFAQLPHVQNGELDRQLRRFDVPVNHQRRANLFATGLPTGNVHFGVTAINTLFLREHNRICDVLQRSDPSSDWCDERLFQTARLILTAVLLKIVIEEYINHIAGPEAASRRLYRLDPDFAEQEPWYRTNRISLEFNLLYRWHCLVPPLYTIDDISFDSAAFLLNNQPLIDYGLGTLLDAASRQSAANPGLFSTAPELLEAEYHALRMSRNYHVAPFNAYRRHFRLPPIADFRDLTDDPIVQQALDKGYGTPDDIDFLVGLYAEQPRAGRVFGDLMTQMLAYDAFTHTLTSPVLSRNVFSEDAFTPAGMALILGDHTLARLWQDNGGVARPGKWVSFERC